MVIVEAGERLPPGIIPDIAFTLGCTINALDKIKGIIEVENEREATKVVEYLKVHGYPNAKVQKAVERLNAATVISHLRYGEYATCLSGKITIKRRGDDYMAYETGRKQAWECGKTPEEAVGKLVIKQMSDTH